MGVPVVLLRNINQSIGLCNGTRILIEKFGDRVGRIMTGKAETMPGTQFVYLELFWTEQVLDGPSLYSVANSLLEFAMQWHLINAKAKL